MNIGYIYARRSVSLSSLADFMMLLLNCPHSHEVCQGGLCVVVLVDSASVKPVLKRAMKT